MITKTCSKNLSALATAYADATGTTVGEVAKEFYGKSTFFRDFAKGRTTVSARKLDEMFEKFVATWPAGAAWPHLRSVIIPSPATRRKLSPRVSRRTSRAGVESPT
jgi:hypothetical protein